MSTKSTMLGVTTLLTVALGACATGVTSPSASTAPPSTAAQSPATGPTADATPGQSAMTSPTAWSSQPLVVNRSIAVPPVPELVAIRPAAHPSEGYDRITFDFRKTLPGYEVGYVSEVVADGSGLPVNVPGRAYLRVVFRPAQAHNDAGTVAVTPRSKTLDYPQMRAYAITGDFEGVLTVVLGLDDVVGFRLGELPGEPGRIYIDVAA
jgi:hypothetical protein